MEITEQNGTRRELPREIDEEDSPDSPPLSLDRLAHQVRQERTERLRQHKTQEIQIAGLMAETGELSALVRHSEEARAADMRLINARLSALQKGQEDLAEGQGRIAAELAARARQDSVHEEAITGVHRVVEATQADVAIVRAKTFGWRALAAAVGYGVLKAIEHWIGG